MSLMLIVGALVCIVLGAHATWKRDWFYVFAFGGWLALTCWLMVIQHGS